MESYVVEAIEFITEPELKLLGYDNIVYKSEYLSKDALVFLYDNQLVKSSWKSSSASLEDEIGREFFRHQLLRIDDSNLNKETVRNYFLFPEVYYELRKYYG